MKGPNMVGLTFGRLTVLSRLPSDMHGNAKWLCRCECGNESTPLGQALRSGATHSCGCLAVEKASANKTHGASHTAAYKAWFGMLQRCTNPNNGKWHRYGGRGIAVCDRWLSYENFLADMGPRPAAMTLDRRENDGNYEPSNCRWATQKQQGNNRGNNRIVIVEGVALTISEAARKAGKNLGTVRGRLSNGWPLDAALNKPTQQQVRN